MPEPAAAPLAFLAPAVHALRERTQVPGVAVGCLLGGDVAVACDGVTIFPPADATDSLTGAIHVEIDLVGSFQPPVVVNTPLT